jgi:23S rRNA pseudouridine2605 synthase/16S rRNA pseudouridine516 synthase
MERLHKVMARAGVASRRRCEEIIASGMVKVDGKVITEPGVKVDPARVKIMVGGEALDLSSTRQYILLYKPRGYITTLSDEKGRKKVTDLLKGNTGRSTRWGGLIMTARDCFFSPTTGTLPML